MLTLQDKQSGDKHASATNAHKHPAEEMEAGSSRKPTHSKVSDFLHNHIKRGRFDGSQWESLHSMIDRLKSEGILLYIILIATPQMLLHHMYWCYLTMCY